MTEFVFDVLGFLAGKSFTGFSLASLAKRSGPQKMDHKPRRTVKQFTEPVEGLNDGQETAAPLGGPQFSDCTGRQQVDQPVVQLIRDSSQAVSMAALPIVRLSDSKQQPPSAAAVTCSRRPSNATWH